MTKRIALGIAGVTILCAIAALLIGLALFLRRQPQGGAGALERTGQGASWPEVTRQMAPDGTLPREAALRAFAVAVAPIPGVAAPPPDDSVPFCGTLPVLWLQAHRASLTPEQRAALDAALAPPSLLRNDVRYLATVSAEFRSDFSWALNATQSFMMPAGEGLDRVSVGIANTGATDARAFPLVTDFGPGGTSIERPARADENPNTGLCHLAVSPNLATGTNALYRRGVLVHELAHCVQYTWIPRDTGFVSSTYAKVPWVLEGLAQLVTNATQNTWEFGVVSRFGGQSVTTPISRDQLGYDPFPKTVRYRCDATTLIFDQNDGARATTSTYRKVRND